MLTALLGKKQGMTQLFGEDGTCHPVTVIQAGPCQVVQAKSKDGKDGYDAIQLGFDEIPARKGGQGDPRANKPTIGHFKRHGANATHLLREIPLLDGKAVETGTIVKVDEVFSEGSRIDVVGTSKGRGFAGCVKRHGFRLGPKTHGSKNYREPGSTGNATTPGHVHKGKRMPGHYGAKRCTVRNLRVIRVEAERNLLYVQGAVPGPTGGYVLVRRAVSPGKKG